LNEDSGIVGFERWRIDIYIDGTIIISSRNSEQTNQKQGGGMNV